MKNPDLKLLLEPGNIGFFESCEVTQLFLIHKGGEVTNLFILACLEDKPFKDRNLTYLSNKPISINKNLSLGIRRYWLSVAEMEVTFNELYTNNQWTCDGDNRLRMGKMVNLSRQFVPGNSGQRLSHVLKNNFHNGSHIIEFFDEEKELVKTLLAIKDLKILEKLSSQISNYTPFDIALVRERAGNIIFQFPVTILNSSSTANKQRDGIYLHFDWHKKLPQGKDCFIQVDAMLDKNYMGATIKPYNKETIQEIVIGNIEQFTHIKIWSTIHSLLLGVIDGTYFSSFSFNIGVGEHEPRIFQAEGMRQKVSITSKGLHSGKKSKNNYQTHILNTLYEVDNITLEKNLSFKQYFTYQRSQALTDIRLLINRNDEQGVYLWDPFLRAEDLLNTLYFSPSNGTELKAIGAINSATKEVYAKKSMTAKQIIKEQVAVLENSSNNNFALNLEFRMQFESYGYAFHDRFLIFPGNNVKRPKVYSLGTSVNSIGKSHHILQEVSHPQRVIDAFNELWGKLNHKDCLVWKYPKI